MSQPRLLKVLAAVVGAASIAVVLAVAAVVTRLTAIGDASLSMFDWLVPMSAGFIVGVAAWTLLASGDEVESPHRVRCESCGAGILEGWRMCPHCGAFIQEPIDGAQTADSTITG